MYLRPWTLFRNAASSDVAFLGNLHLNQRAIVLHRMQIETIGKRFLDVGYHAMFLGPTSLSIYIFQFNFDLFSHAYPG